MAQTFSTGLLHELAFLQALPLSACFHPTGCVLHRRPAAAAGDPAPDTSRSDCALALGSTTEWRTNPVPAEAQRQASPEHLLRGRRAVPKAFRKELRRMPKCPHAGRPVALSLVPGT